MNRGYRSDEIRNNDTIHYWGGDFNFNFGLRKDKIRQVQ